MIVGRGTPAGSVEPYRAWLCAFAWLIPVGFCIASPAAAGVCTVPGTHTTVQEAIDDLACTTINLSAQTYAESITVLRTLTLAGPGGGGAIIEGLVLVAGVGTTVDLNDLAVQNGCLGNAMVVRGGAQVSGTNHQVTRSGALPCPPFLMLFGDGFESGDTSAWSSQVPPP